MRVAIIFVIVILAVCFISGIVIAIIYHSHKDLKIWRNISDSDNEFKIQPLSELDSFKERFKTEEKEDTEGD